MLVRVTNSFGEWLVRDPDVSELYGRDVLIGDFRPARDDKPYRDWEPAGVFFIDKGSFEPLEEQLELRAA